MFYMEPTVDRTRNLLITNQRLPVELRQPVNSALGNAIDSITILG